MTVFALGQDGVDQLLQNIQAVGNYTEYTRQYLNYHIIPNKVIQPEDLLSDKVATYTTNLPGQTVQSLGGGKLSGLGGGTIEIIGEPLGHQCDIIVYPVRGLLIPRQNIDETAVIHGSPMDQQGYYRRTTTTTQESSVLQMQNNDYNDDYQEENYQAYWTTMWKFPQCQGIVEVLSQETDLQIMLKMINIAGLQKAYQKLKNVTVLAFQDQGALEYLKAAQIQDITSVPSHLLQVWLGYNILGGSSYLNDGQIRQTLTQASSGIPLYVTCAKDSYNFSISGSWNQISVIGGRLQACNDVSIYIVDTPLLPLNAQFG